MLVLNVNKRNCNVKNPYLCRKFNSLTYEKQKENNTEDCLIGGNRLSLLSQLPQ